MSQGFDIRWLLELIIDLSSGDVTLKVRTVEFLKTLRVLGDEISYMLWISLGPTVVALRFLGLFRSPRAYRRPQARSPSRAVIGAATTDLSEGCSVDGDEGFHSQQRHPLSVCSGAAGLLWVFRSSAISSL